jgi:hypothetical protein
VSSACTELFNGSTWTAGPAFPIGGNGLTGGGTQNAGLVFDNATTFEFNNGVWTANAARSNSSSPFKGTNGTQARALAFGQGGCTEKYNQTGITFQPMYFNLDELQLFSTVGY